MRALNVFLSLIVSLLIGLALFEVGLRVIGKGPTKTLNQFDPVLGWSKEPGKSIARSGHGWHARFDINANGLREDPGVGPAKPQAFRVIALGDSFTLGFTVEREDLFVDLLEKKWQSEGRALDVVNTGTEGYSTDQEAAWLDQNGASYKPDLVLLFPYENDIFWCSQTKYQKFDKPRYTADGKPEGHALAEPEPKGARDYSAVAKLLLPKGPDLDQYFDLDGRKFRSEFAPLLLQPPAFLADSIARTRGSLAALKARCAALGAKLVVAPIPSEACVDAAFAEKFGQRFGLTSGQWSPNRPVEIFLESCQQLGIPTIDARAALKAAHTPETPAYLDLFTDQEWHFTAHGNHAFAAAVAAELDKLALLPAASGAPVAIAAEHASDLPVPRWMLVFAGLWLVLSGVYIGTYPKSPKWEGPVVVLCMLSLVFALVLGGGWALGKVPPEIARWVGIAVVAALLGFIVYKLGSRFLTATELVAAFVGRGHWYLMPLVVVLLTIGSLLVVAASSPFVAPFIYTLF